MGRRPHNVLAERRSLARALCDLIEKHDRVPLNHPKRLELGRLIRLLSVEITHAKIAAFAVGANCPD